MLKIGEFVYNISTIAPIGIILLGDCLNGLSLLSYMWVSRVLGNRVMLTNNIKCNMLNVRLMRKSRWEHEHEEDHIKERFNRLEVRLMRIVDQIVGTCVKLTSRYYYYSIMEKLEFMANELILNEVDYALEITKHDMYFCQ
jgi:hypothetical protein